MPQRDQIENEQLIAITNQIKAKASYLEARAHLFNQLAYLVGAVIDPIKEAVEAARNRLK